MKYWKVWVEGNSSIAIAMYDDDVCLQIDTYATAEAAAEHMKEWLEKEAKKTLGLHKATVQVPIKDYPF